MATKKQQKPGDPRIIERGKIIAFPREAMSRIETPALPADVVRHKVYLIKFEDGPFPVYQPVLIRQDSTEHPLLDGALAPLWFFSVQQFEIYARYGGYEIIDAPVDDTETDAVDSE